MHIVLLGHFPRLVYCVRYSQRDDHFLRTHTLGEQVAALLNVLQAVADDICRWLVLKGTRRKGRLEENAPDLVADGFEIVTGEVGLDSDIVLREALGARHDCGDKFPSARFVENVANGVEGLFLGNGIVGADTSLTLEGGHDVINNV